MPLEFTNPLVAMLYRPTVAQDRIIHSACYNGLLSNVHECAAERMIGRGSNLIELIPGVLEMMGTNKVNWALSKSPEGYVRVEAPRLSGTLTTPFLQKRK
jgi:hypothetical protein